jgi:hypothetical protein
VSLNYFSRFFDFFTRPKTGGDSRNAVALFSGLFSSRREQWKHYERPLV